MKAAEAEATRGQRGLSLLEVIVYAALSLALIGLAMGGLGTVHKGISNSSEMARMRSDADEAVQVMGRDLRNLGLKRLFYATGPGAFTDTLLAAASFGPADLSSFRHADGAPGDTLVFLRAAVDERGAPTGVDTVTYRLDPATQSLLRAVNGEAPAALCGRVEALQFEYGISAARNAWVDEDSMVAAEWQWTATTHAGVAFAGNAVEASLRRARPASVAAFWHRSAFSVQARRRYAFDIRAAADDALLAGQDSLVAMICTPGGIPVAWERFAVGTVPRDLRVELEAPACGNCRAGIRLALHDKGKLTVSAFAFSEVSQGDMRWTHSPTLAEKPGVRAVRIHLLTGTDKPMHGINEAGIRLANADLRFRDRKGRSLLDEVIPVPNNGP